MNDRDIVRLQSFLKELNKLSNKYNLWIQPRMLGKGVEIYDRRELGIIAYDLDNNFEEYYCTEADN